MWQSRLAEISDSPRLSRAIWLALAILIAWLHLFVHGTRIDHHELVLDEAGTWGVATRPFLEVLTLPTEFHSQPPLYYLILHVIAGIDSSPWVLRGFSWLCCLLVVLFILFHADELALHTRVFASLLFVFSDLTSYLATTVRPYGLATLCTLVSSVLLVRLLRRPTRRRAIAYGIWTTAMLYTMAFDVAVLMVHGLVVAGLCAHTALVHGEGWRPVLRRNQDLLVALAAVGVAYLPYLAMAVHYQYKPNPTRTLDLVLRLTTYEVTFQDHFGLASPMMAGLYALCAFAIFAELRARNVTVWLWPLLAVGQVAFVYFFIIGRSSIGAQGKYMMPAFVAMVVLASLGFQQLTRPVVRGLWPVLVVVMAVLAWPRYQQFRQALAAPRPVGPFETLHREMARQPGKKLIFFDVGYDGQHLEYVIRDDPQVATATRRGRGWASGGESHLTDDYVADTITRTAAFTRCYYYFLQHPQGPYSRVFVPAMQRLGYAPLPPLPLIHGRQVPGFCKP